MTLKTKQLSLRKRPKRFSKRSSKPKRCTKRFTSSLHGELTSSLISVPLKHPYKQVLLLSSTTTGSTSTSKNPSTVKETFINLHQWPLKPRVFMSWTTYFWAPSQRCWLGLLFVASSWGAVNSTVSSNSSSTELEFLHQGTIYPTVGWVHLHATVDFNDISLACQLLDKHVKLVNSSSVLDNKDPYFRKIFDVLSQRQTNLCRQIPDTFQALQHSKRGLWSVLYTMASWLGLSALLDLILPNNKPTNNFVYDLHHLEDEHNIQLRHLNNEISKRFERVETRESTIIQHYYAVEYKLHIQALEIAVLKAIDILTTTAQHKLHPLVLSPKLIKDSMANISRTMNKQEMIVPISIYDHLYQLPISALVNNNDKKLHILLHIPLITSKSSILQLLHFADSYLPVNIQKGIIAKITAQQMMAVNDDNTRFALLSPQQLSQCLQVARSYFCTDLLLQSDFDDHCISRLFRNNIKDAADWCKIYMLRRKWLIFRQNNNWYGFAQQPLPYTLQCTNSSTSYHFLHDWTKLTTPPGCLIKTQQFVIPYPVHNFRLPTRIIHPVHFNDIYSGNLTDLTKIIHEKPKQESSWPLHLLQATNFSSTQWNSIQDNTNQAHAMFTTLHVGIFIIATLSLTAIFTCYIKAKCLQQQLRTQQNKMQPQIETN